MNDIMPIGSGELTRDSRRAGRAISRSRAGAQVRMARVDDETDIALEKVEALSTTTAMAMSAVTRVAVAQRQLEALAPEASGRLAYLADAHLLAVGDTVHDLRRQLRTK